MNPLPVILGFGASAAVSLGVVALSYSRDGSPTFLTFTAIAAAAYVGALVFAHRAPARLTIWSLWLILGLAAGMRAPSLYPGTGTGSDIFRYIWDARLQRLGHNPYLVIPSDPAYAAVHTHDTRRMNNMGVPSPYPPAAQLFFRAVTAFSESPRAFRTTLVLVDLAAIVLLWRFLRGSGRNEWLTITYAWHPLVALEGARNGHLDALGAVFLLIAAVTVARGRSLAGILAFVSAVMIKFLPIVLAPLFWRRARPWHAGAGLVLCGILYWPYARDGGLPIGSVSNVIDRFRFNAPLQQALESAVGAWPITLLAIAAGSAAAFLIGRRRPVLAPEAWVWPMAIALACAPLVYPWYLVWLVPFSTTRATRPLLVWSVTVLAVYAVWGFPPGTPWDVPGWLLAIEYGPVVVTGVWMLSTAAARTQRPRHPQQ